MDDIECSKCGQMLFGKDGKASLIRCTESACPLKAERRRASRVIMVGVLGVGVLIAGLGTGLAMMFKPGGAKVEEVPHVMAPRARDRTRQPAEGSGPIWTGGTSPSAGRATASGGTGASTGPPSLSGIVPPTDALAASTVSTFKCTGRLSGSRLLVCGDRSLAIKDYNLELLFRTAVHVSRHPAAVRKAQTEWLTTLDKIAVDRQAVLDHYRRREAELSGN